MVESPVGYLRPSYQANDLGRTIALYTPQPLYLRLGQDALARERAYRALFKAHVDVDEDALIREATNKGLAVGSDLFKEEVERLSGFRATEMRRGPKPQKEEFLL